MCGWDVTKWRRVDGNLHSGKCRGKAVGVGLVRGRSEVGAMWRKKGRAVRVPFQCERKADDLRHGKGERLFMHKQQQPQAISRCSVTRLVSVLLRAQLFRFAIEAANFHLFQCTAYMFRHAVPGPSAFRGTPSLKSMCAKTELHKPSGVAATDWQACRGSISTLPARL